MKRTLMRWAQHLWLDADDAQRLITPEGLKRLENAVRDSEARHLGELRVCVEGGLDVPRHDKQGLSVIANVALLAIVGIGLNVLIGLTGQVSFGHVGFYAIGAYTVAIVQARWGTPVGVLPSRETTLPETSSLKSS